MIAKQVARKLTTTTSTLSASQHESQYCIAVLQQLLRLRHESGPSAADRGGERFFKELHERRKRESIDEQTHTRVLRRMGIDERACAARGASVEELCQLVCGVDRDVSLGARRRTLQLSLSDQAKQ
uniref:Uncharacterized protein n=1 Tax=Prymnesium polylepis TaxID=72548 RepID=A0A7S4I553_9EUKA|mmetsp:Transcript_23292/g.62456  ORF Transcript_23292/g.62456 Transcript_23292/m.62456 type:complete len:126 (+) Transcript_23292:995-1372(+)